MRILYIDVNCKNSSTGKIVYDLYTQARMDGHEAAVCYGRGPVIKEENIYKFGMDWETCIHAALTRITGWTGRFSPLSTRRLLKFMDEFQPDVIHLHEPHAYFMNLEPLFRYISEKKIPLVYTLHCEFAYTGKCGHAYACERWKTGCGNCPRLREYPKTLWFDHTAAMLREKEELLAAISKLIIATPSKWLADRASQSILKDRDIRIVHNGIDVQNVFHPRDYDYLREKHGLHGERIVLAVAPKLMSDSKGGRWVLKLAEKMSGENVKFILIGVDDLSEQFPSNVIALGRTSNQRQLAEYYSLADCFVICSERENFPTTCLEAFCCGTPVVGFATGGTAETVPAPYGRFCDFGNVDHLAELVRSTLVDQWFWSTGELADHAASLYSKNIMYRQYLSIYQELMPNQRSNP